MYESVWTRYLGLFVGHSAYAQIIVLTIFLGGMALGAGFEAFLHDACVNILSVTKGAVYICMSSSEIDTLKHAFVSSGGSATSLTSPIRT